LKKKRKEEKRKDMDYSKLTKAQFFSLLKRLQDLYTNDEPEVSDEEFDRLKDLYETKFGEKFNVIGAVPRFNKVRLPFFLPSIESKIKGDKALKEITHWMKEYTDDKVISDKIDGFTLLITWDCVSKEKHAYSRGDGVEGQNLDHLIPYLNLPFDEIYSYAVRGEVVLEKDVFLHYVETHEGQTKNKLKNARNLVNGFTTKKKEKLDYDLLSKTTFCAYEIIHMSKMKNNTLKVYELTPLDQFEYLEDFGFTIPWYTVIDKNIDPENLLSLLHKELIKSRDKAPYDIDGLVISDNSFYENGTEQKHKLAYKEDTFKVTTVEDIEWNASSKDGFLNPVIIISYIEILGRDIGRVTGKNAKFIIDNKIGRNAVVRVSLGGDTIPDISEVLKGSIEEDMIYPEGDYEWDDNHVKFVLKEITEDVEKAKIKYFFTHMKIKHMGDGNIDRLYNNGWNTLYKMLSMHADDIVDIMGPVMSLKIVDTIRDGITNVPLYRVIASSTVLGRGMAEERMKDFLSSQNISSLEELRDFASLPPYAREEKIKSVKGWADITASQVSDKLDEVVEWLEEHDMITIKNMHVEIVENELRGKTFVFSGLRDTTFADIKRRIDELGIVVKTSVSSKTDYVVSDTPKVTGKVADAHRLGKPVLSIDEFRKLLGL
jgi:DNA ligase (NAD+)